MNKIKANIKENKWSIMALVLILLVILVPTVFKVTLSDPNSGYLRNQTVDGLSFEDANLVYEDGITTFTANVYNESGDTYSLKTISINLTDSQGNITTLLAYIGDTLDKDGGKYLKTSIDDDLSDSVSIEYVINK